MGHGHHEIEVKQEQFVFSPKAKRFSIILMVLGLILTGIGIATMDNHSENHNSTTVAAASHETHGEATVHNEGHASEASASHEEEHGNVPNEKFGPRVVFHHQDKPASTRIWANMLIVGYFFLMISLTAVMWYAIQYVANAGWSSSIKRVPEAIMTFIPVAFVILMIALFMGKNEIYHWVHYEHLGLKPGDAGYDKVLVGKSGFLNSNMLFIFPTVLVVIWYVMMRKLRSLSVAEDNATKGDSSFFKKSISFSAGFAVLFGFTISVVAWLIIMSVDAHWYSTIFGFYNFVTHWVTMITIMAFVVAYLKKEGYLGIVTNEHMHDLGKFMFAFTVFWAYLWLSQYLLIWYAQIPEEMAYYQIRFEDYKANFLGNFFMCFCIPFLGLLMRSAKRNRYVLAIIGSIMIIGHYHDVWLMVTPGVFGTGMTFGFMEIGMLLLVGGIFMWWVFTALTKRGLIAVNHPFLEESVHHDVGV
jgi:hypothetical protein